MDRQNTIADILEIAGVFTWRQQLADLPIRDRWASKPPLAKRQRVASGGGLVAPVGGDGVGPNCPGQQVLKPETVISLDAFKRMRFEPIQ